MLGRGEKSVQGFGGKNCEERDLSENERLDGRMMSEWFLERLAGDVEWIQLVQEGDRWLALVNTVMNLRVLGPRSSLCIP
jgi:hypothetical protein